MWIKFRGKPPNFQTSESLSLALRTPLYELDASSSSSSFPLNILRLASMLPRTLPGLLPRRLFSVSTRMASMTPMEDVMRDKVPYPHPAQAIISPFTSTTHSYTIPDTFSCTNKSQSHCTAHPRIHPIHPPHPQRLTQARTPRRNGRIDFKRDTLPVCDSPEL